MRLCFFALDRFDLQFPSKELARWMQAPTVGNMDALKRVGRFLIGRGRLTQEFVRQTEEPSHVVIFRRFLSRRLVANTQKYLIIQIVLWFPRAPFH